MALVVVMMQLHPHTGRAGTSYEEQIAGFVYSVLHALIVGEFSGQRPSNSGALMVRPTCKSGDYDVLRATAANRSALDDFGKRCDLIETKVQNSYVHSIAYLPEGYCERLKNAFDVVLTERVYSPPKTPPDNFVTFEYKGANFSASSRALARATRFKMSCEKDGSLQISATRK